MGVSFRISPGENTPENLRRDGTARIARPKVENIFERIGLKAADPDRDESKEFLGINMGPVGQVINKMLFGPPPEVEALRRPLPRTAPPDSARIIQVAVSLFDQRSAPLLAQLNGHAYDVALVAALEFSFRDIRPQLAKLKPAEVDRLASLIVDRAISTRRLKDTSPQGRALFAYAVKMEVERARTRYAAEVTPPPAPPAPLPNPAPTAVPGPAAAPTVTAAEAKNPAFLDTKIAAIRALAPKADATQQEREASAIAVQRLVDSTTRSIIANAPQLADRWVRVLRGVRAQASFVPVAYNDGWRIAVNDGRVVGTTNSKASVSPSVRGQRYRFDLRDVNDTRKKLGTQPVDLVYAFGTGTRFIDAGEYANNLVHQDRWVHAPGWPAGKSPWDLTAVTGYFQHMLDTKVPMPQVYARWQEYLKTFYQHGESLGIQGPGNLLDMEPGSLDRFENDAQGLVNQMLAARTGERLMDCEFFSAITHHVFGHLKDARGQRRFDTKWVTMDVHTTAMVVERGTGPRSWAYINNDNVIANGTTSSPLPLEPAIVEKVAKVTRWGNPSVFAIADTYAGASSATTDTFYGPRTDAYYYDGAGKLSRVSPTDSRAYWIYATTRDQRLTKHADAAEFVSSWNPARNSLPAR